MSEAVFQRCVQAYARYCNQHGYVFEQPSSGSTWENEEQGIFALLNVKGVLARYKVTGDEVDGFSVKRLDIQDEED
jgi:hypothetical protein